MIKYTACFRGRRAGAVGAMSWFNVDIEANSEEEAQAKLYDTHEHFIGLFWLWPGKQTVKEHDGNAHARTKGHTHYVSTYNGYSWCQTNCHLYDIEKVKARHLADEAFMNNYGRKS